jgi:aminopeptidase N
MKNYALLFISILFISSCFSQKEYQRLMNEKRMELEIENLKNKKTVTSKFLENKFRTSATKAIDIIHCDLELKFNIFKHQCIGKESIQLKPYFYETDSIVLDALNMIIDGVTIKTSDGQDLIFTTNYNQEKLVFKLERKIKRNEIINLGISYIARPDLNQKESGSAIKSEKGLYFINSTGNEIYKPIQIWTQGETESNSNWFPTIDKPNEKFTSTITITTDSKYTILSNGKKMSSAVDGNFKTEKWANEKPMSAYLMMMAIGEFDVVKEDLNGKEVSYYLEKNYSPYAREIFAHTKDMIAFYSNRLGVEYPWDKYAQVVVHDYVSGAMENTSATLHGEFVQKNTRELMDGDNDGIISHELFHQWFGDLVTCNEWSQLVLNEGFASYGEWLWIEHLKGKEALLEKAFSTNQRYVKYTKTNPDFPIVNYNYKKPDDMFNIITYQKGALVLNLIRSKMGDDAFFEALKNYLTKYAYANANVHDLQHEIEIVTGQDWRPFFEQWFYRGDHPILQIRYDYNDSLKRIEIEIEQKQEAGLFKFPLKFKIKHGDRIEYFTFDISQQKEIFQVKKLDSIRNDWPQIMVDPDATFIGEIDDAKPILQSIAQYSSADNYIDKIRSIRALANQQVQYDTARSQLLSSINDINPSIRAEALQLIDWKNGKNIVQAKELLIQLALSDEKANVRKHAMHVLSDLRDESLMTTFQEGIKDSSYSVAAKALDGIYKISKQLAISQCAPLQIDARSDLFNQITNIYSNDCDVIHLSFFEQNLLKLFGIKRSDFLDNYKDALIRLKLPEAETNQATNLFATISTNDEDASVRYMSIYCLKEIEKNLSLKMDKTQSEKDKLIVLIQRNQQIIDAENDLLTLKLLKDKDIFPSPSK